MLTITAVRTKTGKAHGYCPAIDQWVEVRVRYTGRGFEARVNGWWQRCSINC